MKLKNILSVALLLFSATAFVTNASGFSLFGSKKTEQQQKKKRTSSTQKMSMKEKISFSMQKRRFRKCYSACKKVIQIAKKDVKKLEKIAKRNSESKIKTSEIETFKTTNTSFRNGLLAISTKNIKTYQEIVDCCNRIKKLLNSSKEKYAQLTSESDKYNKAVKKTLGNIAKTIKVVEKLTNNIENNNIKKKNKNELFDDDDDEETSNKTRKKRSRKVDVE